MGRSASSESYYEAERRVHPGLARLWLPLTYGALLSEELRHAMGLKPVTYVLSRRHGDKCWFDTRKRAIHFTGPDVSALVVAHEIAHIISPDHDGLHMLAVAMLAEYVEGFCEEG